MGSGLVASGVLMGSLLGCKWGVDGQPEAAPSSHTLRTFCRHPEA